LRFYKSAHAASGFAKRPLMLFAGLVCGNEWVGWFPLTEGAGEPSGLLRKFLGYGVGLRGLTFELSGPAAAGRHARVGENVPRTSDRAKMAGRSGSG